ncbi:hypothetical protein OAO87_04525 [bacterium]|nr:hypothetical protein [bacterium]
MRHLSSAASLFEAVAAEGELVTEEERLGDTLANAAHHGDAHKWLVVAWRQMEAAAAPSSCVRLGDKGAGLAAHAEYCASYIGDILIQTDDGKEIVEIKKLHVLRHDKHTLPCRMHPQRWAVFRRQHRGASEVARPWHAAPRRASAWCVQPQHRLGARPGVPRRLGSFLLRLRREPQGASPPRHVRVGAGGRDAVRRATPPRPWSCGEGERLQPDRLHDQPDGALLRAVLRATPLRGLRPERRARHPKIAQEDGGSSARDGGRVRGGCPFGTRMRGELRAPHRTHGT